MKNILLLGGTGFIGKNIIEIYADDLDVNLILIVRDIKSVQNKLFTSKRIIIKTGDFCDTNFVTNIINDYNITVVIHMISNLIASSSDEEFYDGISDVVVPTFKLIDFISNKKIKFLFFSSGGTIYGNAKSPVREETALDPINNYGFSKLLVEDYIRFKSRNNYLDYIIIRPSNVYGNFQSFTGNQGFISVAIKKIFFDESIQIWGDGNSIRDYVYVNDLVEIVHKLLFSSITNITLNLSTGIGKSLLEIISLIESILSKKAMLNFNNRRLVDANTIVLDNSKLLAIIPHKFIGIEKGIEMQVNYFINSLNCAK